MGLWQPAHKQAGQSLVEILVAIAVVTIVLVTLVGAIVVALRGVRFSKEKIRANFLVQQGIEWVRSQRSGLGWRDFSLLASAAGAKYCLKDLNFDQLGGCNESQVIEAIFIRELVLTSVGSGVKVEVTAAWDDSGNQFTSDIETMLQEWEVE